MYKSGWPSGLRRCVKVAVYSCRRGFESHSWELTCFLLIIIRTWSWTPLNQSFFPTFSSIVCFLWCDDLNLLNCSLSFVIKIIMKKSFQFPMLKDCFEIYISCFPFVLPVSRFPFPGEESDKHKPSITWKSGGGCHIAQNAYCSRDIYLQFTKYLRSVVLPIIIQMNARRRVSLVKINALFSRSDFDLAH